MKNPPLGAAILSWNVRITGFSKQKQMNEKGNKGKGAVMTLIQAGKKVGSSTSDPTCLPDNCVTSLRFLLFCGPELGVLSV